MIHKGTKKVRMSWVNLAFTLVETFSRLTIKRYLEDKVKYALHIITELLIFLDVIVVFGYVK